jgi:hypothetical protein
MFYSVQVSSPELLMLQLVIRHGDRSPIHSLGPPPVYNCSFQNSPLALEVGPRSSAVEDHVLLGALKKSLMARGRSPSASIATRSKARWERPQLSTCTHR